MHKELNSMKGGNASLMAFWEKAGIQGPMPLMNRDNAAASALGSSAAKHRAENITQAGGVKTTSLAGALFNHKDDKKGHHDIFRDFFESKLGYPIAFPDTSNTQYQTYCLGAGCLILYLPYFIEFLEQVRDKKDGGLFNHMEQNVFRALHDVPTITELCVLALYSQIISAPYMRSVRGPSHDTTNLLDLGPLHDKVREHCQNVINNPDLVLAADASYELGTLDGNVWDQPDIFYAVQRMANGLPHLREALVAFLQGSLLTWVRFSAEFAPGGAIANATPQERQAAFMRCTNDKNKGALGSFRVNARLRPRMSLQQHNSRAMYKKNSTKYYMRMMSSARRKTVRHVARVMDSSGTEAKRRAAQAAADKAASARNALRRDTIWKRKNEMQTRIDGVIPRKDIEEIRQNPGTMSCGKLVSTGMIVLFRKESFPVCSGWGEVMC
jgi:hypothetical protein